MQKLKCFFTYSVFSLLIATTQAQANTVVVNESSPFYPKLSVNEILKLNSETLPFGINIKEGRYFITWESEELNSMLTSDYAQEFIAKNIEDINTRPTYEDAIEAGEVRYDIIYARRDPISLNVIPVSYDIPMVFEYKDPINGDTKQYRPQQLGLNIDISISDEKLVMKKQIPIFHLNRTQKEEMLNKISTEEYFKQQYIDAFGAVAFAFQVIPEEQDYYKRQTEKPNQTPTDTENDSTKSEEVTEISYLTSF
jgi:hypothetical protein